MAKLLINVLYLSTLLVAILLAASTGVATERREVYSVFRVGTTLSPQACTKMCTRRFGNSYHVSLCKIIEGMSHSKSMFACGCGIKMSKNLKQINWLRHGIKADRQLKGATSCSSLESAASPGSSPGHSSASTGSSSGGRTSQSSGSSSESSGRSS